VSLLERIQQDLKQAIREQNEHRKTGLRLLIARLKNAEIEHGKPLDDAQIVAVISKQAKQHNEAIEIYAQQKRQELVDKETAEREAIEVYLPRQLSRAQIEELARETIREVGATDVSQLGNVMRQLMPKLKGQADGRLVNEIVKEQLAGGQ
jgi:hypothetical protein